MTIYGYLTGSYTAPTGIVRGQGYWALYAASGSNTISGTAVSSASVTVGTGNRWVLVGSVTVGVPASHLTSSPAGSIVSSTLYTYNGSAYVVPTTIEPGRGYWVLINQPCTLTVSQ